MFNVQDPAGDQDALVEQLVPIVAFDERMQNLSAYFDFDGDVLMAVEREDGREIFGWLVRVERKTGCMILAPVERGAPETMRIVLDLNTRWRMCEPPSARNVPELNLDF